MMMKKEKYILHLRPPLHEKTDKKVIVRAGRRAVKEDESKVPMRILMIARHLILGGLILNIFLL
jgi:3-phosphoglycerate kinase